MSRSGSELDKLTSYLLGADNRPEALAAAEYLGKHGVTPYAAAELAHTIADSGARIQSWDGHTPVASIHSTGGPGSLSTSLAPLFLAPLGFRVPVLSVRGGVAGVVDSLAVLQGFRADLCPERALQVLETCGLVHLASGQGGYVPADARLWELRTATHTKSTLGFIAASLLGKKMAVGAHAGSIDIRLGASGNVGASVQAGLEAAFYIRSVADILGLRVGFLLSDSTSLPWPRVGRAETVLSVHAVLGQPAQYQSHPHVRACIALAALAANAAVPVRSVAVWWTDALQVFRRGLSASCFAANLSAQGSPEDALTLLAERCAERTRTTREVGRSRLRAEEVSAVLKAVFARATSEDRDLVGAEQADRLLALLLPPSTAAAHGDITELFRTATLNEAPAAIPQFLVPWRGGELGFDASTFNARPPDRYEETC